MVQLIEEFENILAADQIVFGDGLQDRFSHIWKTEVPLSARAMLLPRTTVEVSEIMKICFSNRQQVIVHGGLTNLVGSTETHIDQIVISMEKMKTIEEVDNISRTMTVQAGVILQTVQEKAIEHGLMFPLNFGAKGSAQIGGIISTNAGGLRVLKYGMTRNLILGLEVVLPDGTIVCSLKKIIKDNSGYDLKQLFVGSEGTLGIVTKAVLKLVEAPSTRNSVFIGLSSYDHVVQLLKHMDKNLNGTMSGFELMWPQFFITATSPPSDIKPPLSHNHNYYVLVESLSNQTEQSKALLESAIIKAMDRELIEDAVLAHNDSDLRWFWTIRENVHAVVSQTKFDQHFDISLPIPLIGDEIRKIINKLKSIDEVDVVFPFGHVADGNIHLIVGKANASIELTEVINEIVYRPLLAIGGSVSAEHGIGVHKKKYLSFCRSAEEIEVMKHLKKTIDPMNLLNRGKVIDV